MEGTSASTSAAMQEARPWIKDVRGGKRSRERQTAPPQVSQEVEVEERPKPIVTASPRSPGARPFWEQYLEPVLFLHGFCFSVMQFLVIVSHMFNVCLVEDQSSPEACQHFLNASATVQLSVAEIVMYNNIISSVVPAISMLIIGAWSDKYGRKAPLLINTFCSALSICGYVISLQFPSLPTWVFHVFTLVDSIGGGSQAFISLCIAYLNDVKFPSNNNGRIGAGVSLWYLGGPLGTIFAYLFLVNDDLQSTVQLVFWCQVFVLTYLSMVIGEKHRNSLRMVSTNRNEDSPGHGTRCQMFCDFFSFARLKESFQTLVREREGNLRKIYICVLVTNSIRQVAQSYYMPLFVEESLQWNIMDYTWWDTYRTTLAAAASTLVMGKLMKCLDIADTTILIMASVSVLHEHLTYYLLAVTGTQLLIWTGPLVGILSHTITIGLQIMSVKLVSRNETGRAVLVLSAFQSLVPAFANYVYMKLYNSTTDTMAGSQFLLSALLTIVMLFVFIIMRILESNAVPDMPVPADSRGTASSSMLNNNVEDLRFATQGRKRVQPNRRTGRQEARRSRQAVSSWWEYFLELLTLYQNFGSSMTQFLMRLVRMIRNFSSSMMQSLMTIVLMLSDLGPAMMPFLMRVVHMFDDFGSTMMRYLKMAILTFVGFSSSMMEALMKIVLAINDFSPSMMQFLATIINMLDGFSTSMIQFFRKIIDMLNDINSSMTPLLMQIVHMPNNVGASMMPLLLQISRGLNDFGSSAMPFSRQMIHMLSDFGLSMILFLMKTIQTLIDFRSSVKQSLKKKVHRLNEFISSMVELFIETAHTINEWLVSSHLTAEILLMINMVCSTIWIFRYVSTILNKTWPTWVIYLLAILDFIGLSTQAFTSVCLFYVRTTELGTGYSFWYIGGPMVFIFFLLFIFQGGMLTALQMLLLRQLFILSYLYLAIEEFECPFCIRRQLARRRGRRAPRAPRSPFRVICDYFSLARLNAFFKRLLRRLRIPQSVFVSILFNIVKQCMQSFHKKLYMKNTFEWTLVDDSWSHVFLVALVMAGLMFYLTRVLRFLNFDDEQLVILAVVSILFEHWAYYTVVFGFEGTEVLKRMGPFLDNISYGTCIVLQAAVTELVT
ncbi:uncharacterized protein [Macrobrachium rosenbergii]|uniref:uncharacterized protein n=1 Tax=Macrobrachium rosenbergii TaxID=79674 RepID=UPI0034D39FA9